MNINDINLETRALCDADSASLTDATLLRRVNNALETVISWIINADGDWQWDDTNRSDLPVGTFTLVEAQESYTFASDYLDIERIKVKTAGGVWQLLKPIDFNESQMPLEERFATTGMPTHYDKMGDTIKLYPAPTATSVTLTAGLKIHFKRTAEIFTSAHVTTGTREPGFASPFHMILPYMMAIPFCMTYKQNRVALYQRTVDQMKQDIIDFYGLKGKDKRKVMKTKSINFR